jgi:microcin C transport system substrate-binding protein
MQKLWPIACLLVVCPFLSGCSESDADTAGMADFEGWYPQYNRYIKNWLADQVDEQEKEVTRLTKEIAAASDGEAKTALQASLEQVQRKEERFRSRQNDGDYFKFFEPSDIPQDLKWENGMDEPEIGDPESKKGGAFRYYIPSFPPTIRHFGPNANNSFRGELYDNIEVMLVHLHPETGGVMPGLAKEWAIGEDKRTVYFRLDPDAKYNDGVPIKAIDYMWFVYIRASDNVVAPWFKQYLREQLAGMAVYGEDVVAITLPEPRPKLAYFAGDLAPAPPHFYKEYGPDFKDRYQWRVPPTTAAYTIEDGGLVKGISITLSRNEDWWAKDKKFYRYRYNADRLVYTVVRDTSKAWELFRAGEIDYFPITLPEYWYEKSEMPPVFDGYIERYTWYNQFPRIPWALYLNTAKKPLDDLNVRLGINHAVNWQKVIDVVFRGDAQRLPGWTRGYGPVDNPAIEARPFSISKAREYFAKAGYDKESGDGILQNAAGKRLEVVLTYGKIPVRERMMVILKEEARRAGLDLVLDGLDHTVVYKKEMQKEHEMVFSAWGFQPPYPRYYEYFHSSNAYDEKGNLKQNTNNVFSYKDERMDRLSLAYRNAQTEEELIELAHEMQQMIHDSGVYIPGFMTEFGRVGVWRWLRWPDSEFTEFSPPMKYIPMESYTYWIDEELKAETLAAKRSGKTFPEVQEIKDRYRLDAAKKPKSTAGMEPISERQPHFVILPGFA